VVLNLADKGIVYASRRSGAGSLAIGRSIATAQMEKLCSTPVKICELSHASDLGNGCSCRVPGGARGFGDTLMISLATVVD